MLPSAPEAGKGKMAAMERLLSANTSVEEPSEEEVALEQAAVKTVCKEMREADEANLLDEEDMHIFDRDPLTDNLPLVSCNTCKKPVKASQYALHAERCRSLGASEEIALDFDSGPVSKKAPRKQRKRMTPAQENISRSGDADKLQTAEGDEGVFSESACVSGGAGDDQAHAVTSSSNTRVMNISEGTVVNVPKVGRPRKNPAPAPKVLNGGGMTEEVGASSNSVPNSVASAPANLSKLNMIHSSLRPEELDIMCGVMSVNGSCCRQPLTCKTHPETSKRAVFGRRKSYDVLVQEAKDGSVSRLRSEVKRKRLHETESNLSIKKNISDSGCPKPLASKIYCLGHNDRMRFVLGHLYRRTCSRATAAVVDTAPAAVVGAQASASPLSSFDQTSLDLKPNVSSSVFQNMSGKMQEMRHSLGQRGGICKPPQNWPQALDQSQGLSDMHYSFNGVQSPHQDSRYMPTSRPTEKGLSSLGKSWQNRGGQLQTSMAGNIGQQPTFGGVSVTEVSGLSQLS